MSIPTGPDFRHQELLAGFVLDNLSPEESAELIAAQQKVSHRDDPLSARQYELEMAAAEVMLLFSEAEEVMPSGLQEKILSDAGAHLPPLRQERPFSEVVDKPSGLASESEKNSSAIVPQAVELPAKSSLTPRELFAWACVAASLLVAAGIWFSGSPGQTPVADGGKSNPENPPAVAASPAEQRQALLAEADDALEIPWQPGKHPFPKEVNGDVVWSNAQQKGFMRFRGMPQNDPTQAQYQLWIIDPQRDEPPIDGGVFDIASAGEVIIPIDAKLAVISPVAFAITVEQPGGVVVSSQDNLPLLAPVVKS